MSILWARYAFSSDMKKQMIEYWIRGYSFKLIAEGTRNDEAVVRAVIRQFIKNKGK